MSNNDITKISTWSLDSSQVLKNIGFDIEGFYKNLDSTKSTITSFRDSIQALFSAVQPFLSPLTQNPLSTVYKQIYNTVDATLTSLTSSGFKAIIIHPFNQSNKNNVLRISVNALDIVNEINFSQATIKNSIKSLDEYEKKLAFKKSQLANIVAYPGNEQQVANLKNEIKRLENAIDLIKSQENYTEKYLFKYDISVPKLSYNEALQELLIAFDRPISQDPNVPKWNELTNVCGLGIIITAETPSEFINKLSKINKLFYFSEIGKSILKFKEQLKEIETQLKDENKKKQDAFASHQEKFISTIKSNIDLLNQANSTKDYSKIIRTCKEAFSKYVEASIPISSITISEYPKWLSLSLDNIKMLKEIKDLLLSFMDKLTPSIKGIDSILNLVIETITAKINGLIDYINLINDTLSILYDLRMSLSGLVFSINYDASKQQLITKGGGNALLKNEITKLQNFDKSLFANQTDQQTLITNLQESQFSLLIFIGGGLSDLNLLGEQFTTLYKTIIGNISAYSQGLSSSLQQIGTLLGWIKDNNYVDFQIEGITDNEIIDKKELDFKILFSPVTYFFSIQVLPVNKNSPILDLNTIRVSSNNISYHLSMLEDKESYIIRITGYNFDKTKELQKIITLKVDTAYKKIEVQPTPTGIGISNNSNSAITVTQKNMTDGATFNFNIIPNANFELPFIFGETFINLDIKKNNEDTLSKFSKKIQVPNFLNYRIVKLEYLKNNKIYTNTFYTTFAFLKEEGIYGILIQSLQNLDINTNLYTTPYYITLTPGDYHMLVLEDTTWIEYPVSIVVTNKTC